MKTLLYHPVTKDCRSTATKPGNKTYDAYIADGYIPVGIVRGFNVVVSPYNELLINKNK